MREWRLHGLVRIRSAEARAAGAGAARARAWAEDEEDAAAAIQARATGLRREAWGGEEGAVPFLAATSISSLARAAAGRTWADGESRRLGVEAARAGVRAAEARSQAERATAIAAAARARTGALARGAARWRASACAARQAALERESEETWVPETTPGTRG